MSVSSTIVNATNTISTDINSYVPLATSAVLSVEQTMAAAPSQSKLTTALGIIMDGAKVGEAIPNPGVAAISSLVDLVDSIVSAFNSVGLFSHASSTTKPITPTITTLSPTTLGATSADPVSTVATSGALAGVATVQPATATPVAANAVSGTTAAPVAHESLGAHVKDFFTGKVDVKV